MSRAAHVPKAPVALSSLNSANMTYFEKDICTMRYFSTAKSFIIEGSLANFLVVHKISREYWERDVVTWPLFMIHLQQIIALAFCTRCWYG